jgi:L,D-peptidoglycan transpeptidase YkuD (ErfK/YbiS/YcfS/YnhG family)
VTLRNRANTLSLTVVLVLAGMGLVPAPAAAVSAPFGQPVTVGDARQILTVKSVEAGSSYARLSGWVLRSGKWVRTFGPVQARVGTHGTTNTARDNFYATPRGTYTLRESFGVGVAPTGTGLPYRRVWANDWWVSDAKSRYYNTWQVGPPNGRWDPRIGERLADYPREYRYAVAIDYNRNPIRKGRGSAFFLHVGNGRATAGCVSVSRAQMYDLMRYLDTRLRPRIAIS